MTAPARITQAEITRAIKAAKAAGMEIGEVLVTAGGDVRIIPVGRDAPADDFEKWVKENDAAKGRAYNPAQAG